MHSTAESIQIPKADNSGCKDDGLLAQLREDLRRNAEAEGLAGGIRAWLTSPGFVVCLTWRTAKYLKRRSLTRPLAWLLWRSIAKGWGCYISLSAEIGAGFRLPHPVGLVIGDGVRLGDNITLYQNVTIGARDPSSPEYPVLMDGTIVYPGAIVLGYITLGYNAIVAANAVVLTDVPSNAVAVGVPSVAIARKASDAAS